MVLFFFFQSQSTIPNHYRSLYRTIFTEAEIGLKSSWKGHLKSPGLVPQFLGKKTQVQRSEINDWPKVIQLRDRSGLESKDATSPYAVLSTVLAPDSTKVTVRGGKEVVLIGPLIHLHAPPQNFKYLKYFPN